MFEKVFGKHFSILSRVPMPTNHQELAAANLQAQVRRNAIEQNEALQDLSAWEKSMKELEDSTDACTVSRITVASQLKNSAKNVSERTAIVSTKSQDIPPALQKSSITIEAQQPVVPMKKAVAKPPPSAILIDVGKSNRNVDDLGLEESAEVKRLEGNALYAKGNFEGAIQCYTKCIQLDPKSVTAFSNRGEFKKPYYLSFHFISRCLPYSYNIHIYVHVRCN